jgi:hypothetical protein
VSTSTVAQKREVNKKSRNPGFVQLYNDFVLNHAREVGPGPWTVYTVLRALARGRPQVAASHRRLAKAVGVAVNTLEGFMAVLLGKDDGDVPKGVKRRRKAFATIGSTLPWLRVVHGEPRKVTVYEFVAVSTSETDSKGPVSNSGTHSRQSVSNSASSNKNREKTNQPAWRNEARSRDEKMAGWMAGLPPQRQKPNPRPESRLRMGTPWSL